MANNTFGHGEFNDNTVAAFTGFRNRGGEPTGVPIDSPFTLNDNGAFFKAQNDQNQQFTVGPRNYVGATLRAQATILIHELAHVKEIPGFQSDAGIKRAGKANDKLVDKNCRVLIEGLQ